MNNNDGFHKAYEQSTRCIKAFLQQHKGIIKKCIALVIIYKLNLKKYNYSKLLISRWNFKTRIKLNNYYINMYN